MSAWALRPDQQHELLTEIASELVAGAPGGWEAVRLVCGGLGYAEEVRADAVVAGERVEVKVSVLAQLDLQKLRRGMHRDGRGTWFTLKLRVVPPGRYEATYDYDSAPAHFDPRSVEELAPEELRRFPRDPDQVPVWLGGQAAEGAAVRRAAQGQADRLLVVDWDDVRPESAASRTGLMREYLRRAALWRRLLQAGTWPFFDVAEIVAPAVAVDEDVLLRLESELIGRELPPQVVKTALWSVKFEAVLASGAPTPGLPHMFAPLTALYERGGGFTLDPTGMIDLGGPAVRRGTLLDHHSHEPVITVDPDELDRVDGA
ncbi:hypothetical protein [Nocardiopsis suaedae]|uniref:Uncharacterized protein n=1 Tax=Nocardiopsis suaedae TaxID=3018444 RepID=A0ABT4TNR0_9ACTN|nr:hypothetical protein [Nocardiopsis suaedae]MDA2805894.1 hypothetical protein [Nocardiopsis suaedae]